MNVSVANLYSCIPEYLSLSIFLFYMNCSNTIGPARFHHAMSAAEVTAAQQRFSRGAVYSAQTFDDMIIYSRSSYQYFYWVIGLLGYLVFSLDGVRELHPAEWGFPLHFSGID